MQKLLALPRFTDENDLRRARLLRLTLGLMLLVTLLAFPLVLGDALPVPLEQFWSLLAVEIVCAVLLKMKRLNLASTVLTWGIWWIIAPFSSATAGIPFSPIFAIVMAGLLMPGRWVLVIAVLSGAFEILRANTNGWTSVEHIVVFSRLSSYFFTGSVTALATRDFRRILKRLETEIDVRERLAEQLATSEARSRQLLERLPVAIIVNDPFEKGLLYINPAGMAITGATSVDDFKDQHFRDYMPPEDFQKLANGVRHVYENPGQVHQVEYRQRRFDGEWADLESRVISMDFEGTQAILSVVTDVTARKQVEALLRESENLYRQFFEHLPVAITVSLAKPSIEEMVIVYANPAAARTMGAENPEALLGKHTLSYVLPEDRDPAIRRLYRSRFGGVYTPREYKFRRLDGEIIDVETIATAITYEGEPAFLSTFTDITARKQAENTLRESEARHRQLYESSPVAIVVTGKYDSLNSHSAEIIYSNPAGAALYRAHSAEDIIGRKLSEFLDEDMLQQSAERVRLLEQGHITLPPLLYRMRCLDGDMIDVEVSGSVMAFDGQMAYVSVMNDVTERRRTEVLLRESEERHRQLYETSPMAIVVCTLVSGDDMGEAELIYINPAGIKLHGAQSEQEVIGRKAYEFFDSDALAQAAERAKLVRAGHTTLPPMDYRLHRVDGQVIDVEVSGAVIEFGGRRAYASVMNDITERKRAEAILRESEERHRQLYESSPVAIVVNSIRESMAENELVYVNPAAAALFGVPSVDDLIGLKVTSIFDTGTVSYLEEVALKVQSGELGPTYEHQVPKVDGQMMHLQVTGKLIEFDGRPAYLSVVNDVTAVKQAQRALEISEQRYRDLMNASPYGVSVTEPREHRILYINPAGARILGAESPESLMGVQIVGTHFEPEEVAEIIHKLRQGIPTDAGIVRRVRRVDGQLIDLEVIVIPFDFDGHMAGLSMFTDVTQRLRLEAEEAEAARLRLEYEKERQISLLRESFMEMILHEFRTPLTVILSSKDILAAYYDRLDATRRQTHFDKITQSVNYGVRLLDNILVLSKANAGLLDFNPRPVDLGLLLKSYVEEFSMSVINPPPMEIHIDGVWSRHPFDEELIRLMVDNLLNYMANLSPNEVQIALKPEHEEALMIFASPDTAIPNTDLPHMFEPFLYRQREAQNLQGNRLSLAVVKVLVEQHRGSIHVESTPDRGMAFTICLPLLK
ncbi:MAG: hypothetical protein OHK0046_16550 [Anaerolineae bacterium]